MIVAGLDPGKNGALVTLFEDGSTTVSRVPLEEIQKPGRKSKSTVPAYREWARAWRQQLLFSQPDVIVIEQVGAWSGQGVTSAFNFGRVLGFAEAILCYVDVPWHRAPPNVWKQRMGVSDVKADAIEEAKRLIPSLAPELNRKKDDGVAEAGLLAYYGIMTIAAK